VSLPFADLRVISIEQYGAGPFATMQLADLGADVIRVEDPRSGGDAGRYVPPYAASGTSLFFESFNRGKRSVALDLRVTEARGVLEDLVAASDALVYNLRGDQPERLRLRYADLATVNPRLVCVSLSAFGTTGPRAAQGGYDFTIQGIAGWMQLTGGPDQPPTKSGLSLADYCAGYVTALATIAGIWRARDTGEGCDVDVSLLDAALAQLAYVGTWVATAGYVPERMPQSAHLSMVPFQSFDTEDGMIVIACPKESLWRRLCSALDREDLANDARFASFEARYAHRVALVQELSREFRRRSTREWLETLECAGVPCGAVNEVREALNDPQVNARGCVVEYEHPVFGTVRTTRSPFRLTPTGTAEPRRAPFLGEDTDQVLARVCGYGPERIADLRAAGALGAVPQPAGVVAEP
jgi:crotonobetainyl-CoA:carnitine CoA-transferase CaiB-like acyl-CoA transferase